MSATTFSNMSDPDILLSVQAYTIMKLDLENKLLLYGDRPKYLDESESAKNKIARLNQLVDALQNEWTKRDNS
ncbi:MAG: hypothetical protein WCK09_00245 [Bacteroidota bacterium]